MDYTEDQIEFATDRRDDVAHFSLYVFDSEFDGEKYGRFAFDQDGLVDWLKQSFPDGSIDVEESGNIEVRPYPDHEHPDAADIEIVFFGPTRSVLVDPCRRDWAAGFFRALIQTFPQKGKVFAIAMSEGYAWFTPDMSDGQSLAALTFHDPETMAEVGDGAYDLGQY